MGAGGAEPPRAPLTLTTVPLYHRDASQSENTESCRTLADLNMCDLVIY